MFKGNSKRISEQLSNLKLTDYDLRKYHKFISDEKLHPKLNKIIKEASKKFKGSRDHGYMRNYTLYVLKMSFDTNVYHENSIGDVIDKIKTNWNQR